MVWETNEISDGSRSLDYDFATGRRYTKVFEVITDIQDADPWEVYYGSAIPTIYGFYSSERVTDRGAIITGLRIIQDAEMFTWKVHVNYSSRPPGDPNQQSHLVGGGGSGSAGQGASPPNDSPFSDPPKWAFSKVTDQEVLNEDKSSPTKTIQTTAGQPLAPRPTAERGRLRLTFTRNEALFKSREMKSYWDTVNEKKFLGWDPGQVKCESIVGVGPEMKNNIPYIVATYIFDFNEDGWQIRARNRGTTFLKTADDLSTQTPVIKSGMTMEGVDLALDGTILPPGDQVEYLDFVKHVSKDFDPLKIRF